MMLPFFDSLEQNLTLHSSLLFFMRAWIPHTTTDIDDAAAALSRGTSALGSLPS
jgi:hypothetical protein